MAAGANQPNQFHMRSMEKARLDQAFFKNKALALISSAPASSFQATPLPSIPTLQSNYASTSLLKPLPSKSVQPEQVR